MISLWYWEYWNKTRNIFINVPRHVGRYPGVYPGGLVAFKNPDNAPVSRYTDENFREIIEIDETQQIVKGYVSARYDEKDIVNGHWEVQICRY